VNRYLAGGRIVDGRKQAPTRVTPDSDSYPAIVMSVVMVRIPLYSQSRIGTCCSLAGTALVVDVAVATRSV